MLRNPTTTRPTIPSPRRSACSRARAARRSRACGPLFASVSAAAGATLRPGPNRSQPAASATVNVNSSISFFTIGPITAISARLEGRNSPSDSSCRPPTTSCTAINRRTAEVSEKNGLSGTRNAPRANSTPKIVASTTPTIAPSHNPSPWLLNPAADRNTAVSTPSRYTMASENTNSPSAWPKSPPPRVARAIPDSISDLKRAAEAHIHHTRLTTSSALTSIAAP